MRFSWRLSLLCLAGFLLAACGGEQAAPSEAAGTAAAPSMIITASPTSIPKTPARAAPPKPTSTPAAIKTPVLDEFPIPGGIYPTPSPAPTKNPTPTINATAKKLWEIMDTVLPECGAPQRIWHSPEGNWTAIECLENLTGFYNVNDQSKTWVVPYIDSSQSGTMSLEHWSKDGNYVYLAPYPCCMDGCRMYAGPPYEEGLALFRLDLATGQLSQTINPGDGWQFYNFSFSPNDRFLAYIQTWIIPPIIHITDLVQGGEQQVQLDEPYSGAGHVIWSPDFSQIAFSAAIGEVCEENYSIITFHLKDYTQEVLLEGLEIAFRPVAWPEENLMILQTGYSEYSTFNLDTGEMQSYDLSESNIEP